MTPELDAMLRRLHMPTVRRLWSELQVRAEQEGMGYADYLSTLMAEEIAHRGQTRVQRMTRRAKFPFLRTIEEFDFSWQSGLRKELLGPYLGPELVSEGGNLIAYGRSGTGKSHAGGGDRLPRDPERLRCTLRDGGSSSRRAFLGESRRSAEGSTDRVHASRGAGDR